MFATRKSARLGVCLVLVRSAVSLWLLRWRERILRLGFGEADVQLSSFFVACVGLGFVAAGLWPVMGRI